jgi:crotonobetainyl-CoA:carnitine CoA-transferase CaiB-like acyl-CoA transferase
MNHIAYGDPIGGLNAAAALLVAIFHKNRTNQGQHIDISQVECMLPMVAPWLIEQSANGTVAPRSGGRHPSCVPHGCFPCRGDDAWILIAVEDDGQWQALCGAIGRDDLKQDTSLATRAGRRLHEAAIEQAIAAWTAKMTADDAMATLQHAGVAAGVARPPLELLDDPHLQARHFWQWIDRPFVGSHPQPSPAYRENGRPLVARHPAPTLGEYNIPVLRDILRTVANRNRQTRCRRHYRNQGRSSQSPQGTRGSWLIHIAFITHGIVADRMTISQAIRPVLTAA